MNNIEFKLLKANSHRQYVRIHYNQKISYYEIKWNDNADTPAGVDLDSIKHQTTEKYIQLYNLHRQPIRDSLDLTVIAQNYLGDYDTSHIRVKFLKAKRTKKDEKKAWKAKFEISPQDNLAPEDSIELKFTSDKPIILYDSLCLLEILSRDTTIKSLKMRTDSITFDSLSILQNDPQAIFTDSSKTLTINNFSLQIIDTLHERYLIRISEPTLKETVVQDTTFLLHPARPNFDHTTFTFPKFTYRIGSILTVKAHAFISIDMDSSEVQTFTFESKNRDDFGLIAGQVLTSRTNIIVQLLDENNKVTHSMVGKTFVFDYIEPGKKHIRLIDDHNQNGVWDKGRFLTRKTPEPTFFFEEEIKLKANWEIKDIQVIWKP